MNKLSKIVASTFLAIGLGTGALLAEQNQKAGNYPLDTCVVSGDKLEGGAMGGEAIDYIYKETGKPDRLVRLCCKGCIKDFNKNPAKYLKVLDDAEAAAKTKVSKSGCCSHEATDHFNHNH